LLGWRPDSGTRFRHRRDNPVPYDVVVVDEVSMVSLVQMARLLEALRDTTRLVLVGDPGQLASVEAGAVLADVVAGFEGSERSPVVSLTTTHRTRASDGSSAVDLDELARDLREGRDDAVVERLTSGSSAVRLVDPADEHAMGRVLDQITDAAYAVTVRAEQFDEADAGALVDLVDDHRLLCAHREGPYGVGGWNRQVQRLVEQRTGLQHFEEWYAGRPVLVTANDSGLGLSNGDLGITVRLPDGRLRVLVRIGASSRLFAPTRLSGVETVYAMTVHKSQGSEARAVTVVLPPEDSRLLTRELFYTAVTRARERVTVIGTEAELRAAMGRRVQRASGLADRLR
ncbi:MAG TPA: AAA family ATPase, partial [Marmoricola sp.]|nr:AAA family ATPase [Marmoricola sp.]